MTSKKSSLDVFKFTFKDTAKSNILISFIVLLPALFIVFGEFVQNVFLSSEPFIMFSGSYAYQPFEMNAIFFAVMIIWSCLFAMKTFGFLSKKKECNVYLSLGISRNKLFYSKYIGGAVGIVGTLTVIYAFKLLFSWIVNGLMIEGFTIWVFYYISTLVTCLAAYTVAVYAFVNAGNLVEGIIFTFFFGIFWPVFVAVINQAFSVMVYGNAYGTQMYIGANFFSSDIWFMDIFGSYTEQLDTDKFNGLTKAEVAANGFEAPDWAGVVFAAFVIVAITYIAGRMFKNRTSEICGFVLRSKNLYKTFLMLLGIVMGLSLMSVISMPRINVAVISVLITIVFVFVGWLICDRKVPVKATVALAVISVVFLGGCFIGYGDDVPEKADIKAIDISMDFSYLEDADPSGYMYLYGRGLAYMLPTAVAPEFCYESYYTTLSSENDIEWALDIHSSLIKDGYNYGVDGDNVKAFFTIAYLLNDGTTIVRNYTDINLETYKKILSFSDTENGKNLMDYALTSDYELENSLMFPNGAVETQDKGNHYFNFFDSYLWSEHLGYKLSYDPLTAYYRGISTGVALADKDLSYVGMIDNITLEDAETLLDNEFFNALMTDIRNQTVEQRYFHSAEDEIGAVLVTESQYNIGAYYSILSEFNTLKQGDKFYGNFPKFFDYKYYGGSVEDIYESYDVETYDYEIYEESYVDTKDSFSGVYENDPESAIKATVDKGAIGENFYVYVITKDMTNTIEYLKKAGLYDELMKDEEKPVSVRIDKTEFVFDHYRYSEHKDRIKTTSINSIYSMYDYSYWADLEMTLFATPEITDADLIETLYDNSLMYSGKIYGGYIAEFFYADGKQVSRFVPASVLTEEIQAKIDSVSAG